MPQKTLVWILNLSLLLAACVNTEEEKFDEDLEDVGLEPTVDTSPLMSFPDGNPLATHAIYFATSTDGENWSLTTSEPLLMAASVPNLIELNQDIGDFKAGMLLTHFVDASEMTGPEQEKIGYIFSEDGGETWSELANLEFEDLPEGMVPVDPCIVELPDGRLRLYFFDIAQTGGPSEGPPPEAIYFYSALSEDGIHFTFEGEVFESNTLMTDPEVIWFEDRWLMYNPGHGEETGGGILISESSDGTSFELLSSLSFQGIPGAFVEDGTIHLFGCEGGISQFTSTDGVNFTEQESIRFDRFFCDPDPVLRADGSYAMILKTDTKSP